MLLFPSLVLGASLLNCVAEPRLDDARRLAMKGNIAIKEHRDHDALEIYRSVFKIFESFPSCADERVAIEINLSLALRRLSRAGEAEAISKQAVQDAKRAFGEKHPVTGAALEALAVLYLQLKRPSSAIAYLKQRLDGTNAGDPAQARQRFALLTSIGEAYTAVGQNTRAEQALREAIDVHRPLAPDRALGIALNNLGLLAIERGDRSEGMTLETSAADVFRLVGGENDIVVALVNIAAIHLSGGALERADATIAEMAATVRRWGHSDCISSALLRCVQAGRDLKDGRKRDAARQLKEAIDIYSRWLAPVDPTLLKVKRAYAILLSKTGRKKEAKALEAEIASASMDDPPAQNGANIVDYRALLKLGALQNSK